MRLKDIEALAIHNYYMPMEDLDRPKPLKRGHYDSVTSSNPINNNDDCSCGSGLKYKKCCKFN